MLVGTKYGQVRDFYFVQTNNAVEYVIRAIKAEMLNALKAVSGIPQGALDLPALRGYLESCGAEEVVNNCANLLGPDLPGYRQLQNIFPGWKGPQLDDVTMLCFSDPSNAVAWVKAISGFHGDDLMENRYMELHVIVAEMMFGIKSEWKRGRTYDECAAQITAGNSVGMLIPGHFISSGILDTDTGQMRIKDSWPGRKPEWNGDGFLHPITREEFAAVDQTVVYFHP